MVLVTSKAKGSFSVGVIFRTQEQLNMTAIKFVLIDGIKKKTLSSMRSTIVGDSLKSARHAESQEFYDHPAAKIDSGIRQ